MTKKSRRSYSREFKQEAVEYWQSSGKTAQEVANSLELPDPQYLRRWKLEFSNKGREAFPGNGKMSEKDAEIARLKKQLRDTEQERDILKKAMAIFSRY